MQDFIKFLAKYSYVFLFIFLEIIAFNLIIRNNSDQRDIFITSSNALSGKLFTKINKLKNLWAMDELMDSVMKENVMLREQLSQSQYTYAGDPQIIQDSLKQLHYRYYHAKIIDKSLSFRNNLFTINKGYLDGIKKGWGIIDHQGIIGIVQNADKYFSTVIPLANTRISVSVILESSNALGNLIWDGSDPRKMIVEGVPKHISVQEGERVLTSGHSLFPRGITVGRVSKVDIESGSNFYQIEIILNNDLYTAYNVMVVENLLSLSRLK